MPSKGCSSSSVILAIGILGFIISAIIYESKRRTKPSTVAMIGMIIFTILIIIGVISYVKKDSIYQRHRGKTTGKERNFMKSGNEGNEGEEVLPIREVEIQAPVKLVAKPTREIIKPVVRRSTLEQAPLVSESKSDLGSLPAPSLTREVTADRSMIPTGISAPTARGPRTPRSYRATVTPLVSGSRIGDPIGSLASNS